MAALKSTLADEWGQQLPNGVVGVTIWIQTRPISGTKMFYLAQAYIYRSWDEICLLVLAKPLCGGGDIPL